MSGHLSYIYIAVFTYTYQVNKKQMLLHRIYKSDMFRLPGFQYINSIYIFKC